MRKKLLPVLSLVLALVMAVALVVPAFALRAPQGANQNALEVFIGTSNAGPYHIGGRIHYVVTVSVPQTLTVGVPCYQDNITTSFDPVIEIPSNLVGDDVQLGTGLALLPGESETFDETGDTYVEYDPIASGVARADLISGNATMPDPAFYKAPVFTANPHPILNYLIQLSDLVFAGGEWQVTACDHILNPNGAYRTDGSINDSNNKTPTATSVISIPNTNVTISANPPGPIDSGQSTTLTVTENNTGDVPLTNPVYVRLLKNNAFFADLNSSSGNFTSSNNTDNILDVGEIWTWTLDTTLADTATFQATGHGIEEGTSNDITYIQGDPPQYSGERKSVTINVNSPGTQVSIGAPGNPVVLPPSGGLIDLTITEHNSGQVDLHNVHVTVTQDGVTSPPFATLNATGAGGDGGTAGVLEAGETWTWTISSILITQSTFFEATGYGEYGSNPVKVVTYPGNPSYPLEYQRLDITVPPPHETPGLTYWGIGLLIAGFAGLMVFFGYRRIRRTQG